MSCAFDVSNMENPLDFYKLFLTNENMEYDFRFKRLENCDNLNGTLKLVPKLNIYYGKMYLSGHILVLEEVQKFSEVLFEVERCHDQEFMCENFQVWKLRNFCNLISTNGQMWSSFMNDIHPPLRCPLKKGMYELQNATADPTTIILWYPDYIKYHWKARFRAFDAGRKECFCVSSVVYTFVYRKKKVLLDK